MKLTRFAQCIGLVLLIASGANAQLEFRSTSGKVVTIYDWGVRRKGEFVEVSLFLRNRGASAVQIGRIKGGSGCTVVPALSRDALDRPLILQPKQSIQVDVTMDTAQPSEFTNSRVVTPVPISRAVEVFLASDNSTPFGTLEVRGNVSRGVHVSSPKLDLGEFDGRKGASSKVQLSISKSIFVNGRTKLESSDSSLVKIRSLNSSEGAKGTELVKTYLVVVPAGTPACNLSGKLRLVGLKSGPASTLGDPKATPVAEIPFVGTSRGALVAEPSAALFGRVYPATDVASGQSYSDVMARTRWILIKSKQKVASRDGRTRAAVGCSSPHVYTELVPIGFNLPKTSLRRGDEQPLIPPQVPNGSQRSSAVWLRVTFRRTAPTQRVVNGTIRVTSASRDAVLIPFFGERL